jgi:hypothetical protein
MQVEKVPTADTQDESRQPTINIPPPLTKYTKDLAVVYCSRPPALPTLNLSSHPRSQKHVITILAILTRLSKCIKPSSGKEGEQTKVACEKNQENENCVRNQISCLKMSRQLLPALVHSSSYLGPKRPSAADCGEYSLGAIDGTQSRLPGKEEELNNLDKLFVSFKRNESAGRFLSIVVSHIVLFVSQPFQILGMVRRCRRSPPKGAFG